MLQKAFRKTRKVRAVTTTRQNNALLLGRSVHTYKLPYFLLHGLLNSCFQNCYFAVLHLAYYLINSEYSLYSYKLVNV